MKKEEISEEVGDNYDPMEEPPEDPLKNYVPGEFKGTLKDTRAAIDAFTNEGFMKISRSQLRRLIKEELEKLPSYDYYGYGIDHVPEKTKGHEDIIGHT